MELSFLSLLLGIIIALGLFFLSRRWIGFSAQDPMHYAETDTHIDIRQALRGDLICEGVIYGPFGRVTTRFVADMHGHWEGNKGHLVESFKYASGGGLEREWFLEVADDRKIYATAPDIVGTAKGTQQGPSVLLNYQIKLPEDGGGYVLSTTDWMYQVQNGAIINRSEMRKFGIKVAELVATIRPK